MIRPIMEYDTPALIHPINSRQMEDFEKVQRRLYRIAHHITYYTPSKVIIQPNNYQVCPPSDPPSPGQVSRQMQRRGPPHARFHYGQTLTPSHRQPSLSAGRY